MVGQFGCKFARNLSLYVSVLNLNNFVHKGCNYHFYQKELLELLQFLLLLVSGEKINLVREGHKILRVLRVCVGGISGWAGRWLKNKCLYGNTDFLPSLSIEPFTGEQEANTINMTI